MSQGPTKGVPIDTDGSLSANLDTLVPSEKAVKTYVDASIAAIPVGAGFVASIVTGTVNGSNKTFTVAPAPSVNCLVMADGEVLTVTDDYSISSSTLTIAAGRAAPTQWVKVYDSGVTALGVPTALRTLKETIFAGITPTSYTNGNIYTIDGSAYTCQVVSSGAVDMVATGLRIRQGTSGGSNSSHMKIVSGGTGDFASIVGETRFRRGNFAIWSRIASYDFTTASGLAYSGLITLNPTGEWGIGLRNRCKNFLGTPNTATGGVACDYWWTAAVSPTSYPGVSTADVLMAYCRTPQNIDVYYGTYSGGWPTIESMTLMGTIQMQTTGFVTAASSGPAIATSVDMWWQMGGSNASSGTFEVIYDRWRITSWD